MVRAAAEIHEVSPEQVVVAKANCGVPQIIEGTLWYPTASESMSDYARLALDAGARIVGACCGSVPDHIAQIRAVVDSHEPAGTYDPALVDSLLGSRPDGATAQERPRRRSRRRDATART